MMVGNPRELVLQPIGHGADFRYRAVSGDDVSVIPLVCGEELAEVARVRERLPRSAPVPEQVAGPECGRSRVPPDFALLEHVRRAIVAKLIILAHWII